MVTILLAVIVGLLTAQAVMKFSAYLAMRKARAVVANKKVQRERADFLNGYLLCVDKLVRAGKAPDSGGVWMSYENLAEASVSLETTLPNWILRNLSLVMDYKKSITDWQTTDKKTPPPAKPKWGEFITVVATKDSHPEQLKPWASLLLRRGLARWIDSVDADQLIQDELATLAGDEGSTNAERPDNWGPNRNFRVQVSRMEGETYRQKSSTISGGIPKDPKVGIERLPGADDYLSDPF